MNSTFNEITLTLINPAVLPALRTAATFFLLINLLGGTYVFVNRHRLFDQDPNVDNDIPAVRKLRIEVVMIPWLFLTTLLVILLINLSGTLDYGAGFAAVLIKRPALFGHPQSYSPPRGRRISTFSEISARQGLRSK